MYPWNNPLQEYAFNNSVIFNDRKGDGMYNT